MSAVDPSAAEVLEALRRSIVARVHTSIPGEVVSFNPLTNTVDVKLAIKDFVFDGDGERAYDDPIVFPSVPVVWPRGGGYVITVPLKAGDFVWLMFAERSLAEWRTTGQVSEPLDSRRLSVGYPVALPGAFPDVEVLSPEPTKDLPNRTSKMVVGKDGHGAQIVIDGDDPITPTIKIGRDATDFVALAALVQTALDAIRTAFNTHVHTSAAAGSPTTTPMTPPAVALSIAVLGPVAATMTKAK